MNENEFMEFMIKLDARKSGIKFEIGMSLNRMWDILKRSDWMCRILVKMLNEPGFPDRSTVGLALCDCAETALPIWEKYYPDDKRPRIAIETQRMFSIGEANSEELFASHVATKKIARCNFWNIVCTSVDECTIKAAQAASKVSNPVAFFTDVWTATNDAASAIAWDAGSNWHSTWDDAHIKMCELIRKRIPVVYKEKS